MAETDGVPVDELIAEVKNALIAAGVTSGNGAADLRVVSVRMILKVVATKAEGATVNFQVPFIGTEFRLGAKHGQHDTHTIDIALVPPSPSEIQAGGFRSGGFQQTLEAAIGRVRQTVASAAGGNDPWFLSEATVDISFGVTREGVISVGIEGHLTSETTNTLQLSLAPALTAGASSTGN
jgi:Trypsin-co-occurring domain 2